MPESRELAVSLASGKYDRLLASLYGRGCDLNERRERLTALVTDFESRYGHGREVSLYSVPGRVEICGNHTDHNNGTVIAGAVNLDIAAVVARSDEGLIRVTSAGFGYEDVVGIGDLSRDHSVPTTSAAMIRGVAEAFGIRGGRVGGLDIYTSSEVIKGSGLSSSAAFEVLIGAVINGEYNDDAFSPIEIGIMGQYAENVHFGKPSGLMDQLACSVGGLITIDFKEGAEPAVKRLSFDLERYGYNLVITDTKGSHASLTDEYAAIRREMESVARYFHKGSLREVDPDVFYGDISGARESCGDRAVLRALHFFEECRRVLKLGEAIEAEDIDRFLAIIVASGRSSFEYNQNAYAVSDPTRQGVPIALALSEWKLHESGAWRLQGGGFAGTIQAYVPDFLLDDYCRTQREVFGDDACHRLSFRGEGAINIAKRGNRR